MIVFMPEHGATQDTKQSSQVVCYLSSNLRVSIIQTVHCFIALTGQDASHEAPMEQLPHGSQAAQAKVAGKDRHQRCIASRGIWCSLG